MNFEAVIGLELHVAMKTKTKMFSASEISFEASPNTRVSLVDIGFPGTLPLVNKQAVINAIITADALNMEIDSELHFDRKNYFYPDLAKGYQITQARRPIGANGYIELKDNNETKRIGIERLHLEEDTAAQHHEDEYTLIDYNRAGIPLIEIVSHPELRSANEAMKFIEAIREIVVYKDVSDGKMEEGSLRCDVNISLRLHGEEKFGTKVEIKNLNSIANVGKAIEYEINRQAKQLLKGKAVIAETRRYDDAARATISMRRKDEDVDYRYFPEADIPIIHLSDEFIKSAIENAPESASLKRNRYIEKLGLSEYDANIILQNKADALYFDEAAKLTTHYKTLANWMNGEVLSYLNEHQVDINKLPIKPTRLASLVNLIESGQISNKQGRDLFKIMLEDKRDPQIIANEKNMMQISDESVLIPLVEEILRANPQSIEDYKGGKDRALGYLVGQVMKKTRGKANPAVVNQIVSEQIKKY